MTFHTVFNDKNKKQNLQQLL